jgi:phospholipase C
MFRTIAQKFILPGSILALALSTAAPASEKEDTSTPIKHLVVIFQENVSFDHYFGTYPNAKPNKDGSQYFRGARQGTPRVNSLVSAGLLTNNPNGANPFRIDRSNPNTCDQDHGYADEQFAFHGGLMDQFLKHSCNDPNIGPNSTLGYYDGNTVTALWNYAQHFAMSDNSFGTSFGPSTPGLLNLVAGTTFEGTITNGRSAAGNIAGGATTGAVIGDPDPAGDICSNPTRTQIQMSGQNIGDVMNGAGVTWGSFMGGFKNCATAISTGITGLTTADYIPHHAFFQYWSSTANPNHTPRTSVGMIGHQGDAANHNYDLTDFWDALAADNLPAVSFIKARAIEDGHAGYSDPLDEQNFLVQFINKLQKSSEWRDTAVIIMYDDSDGWYDHVMGPIVNQSNVTDDQLLGPGDCGTPKPDETGAIQNGRCGYGPRLPLLVVSPYARANYVDHRVTDQASVIRFIEDNWKLDRVGNGSADAIAGTLDGLFDFDSKNSKLFLDPLTGKPSN